MKNNLKALLLHFAIVVLSIIFFIILAVSGPTIGKYATHIISRLFIVFILVLAYIFAGRLLDTSANKKYDFFAGSLITIVGIALWLYTFSITGESLTKVASNIPEELGDYWIVMNIYHTPFIFLRLIFELPNIPIISLVETLIPPLLMGFGLKLKRLKNKEN